LRFTKHFLKTKGVSYFDLMRTNFGNIVFAGKDNSSNSVKNYFKLVFLRILFKA